MSGTPDATTVRDNVGRDCGEATDEALMARAAAGDDDAFCRLVERNQRVVANFLIRCGVERDVEDLTQRTFLKLHRVRRSWKPTAKFATFLLMIAKQTMIDSIRATRRREDLHRKAAEERETVEDAPLHRGESQDAAAALACLSAPLREAVVLVVMQGLAYGEAAQVLDVPIGTGKSRVNAALGQMRKELSK